MTGNPLKPNGNTTGTATGIATGTVTAMPLALLSPDQAAQRAGLSRTTIRNAIDAKELKATRNNEKRWKIRPEDLQEWMAGRENATGKATGTRVAPPLAPDATPLPAGEGVYRVEIDGLRARLADAYDTIDDLRSRLDMQAEAYTDALGAMEARHREALSAEMAKREASEARVVTLLEGQAAAAKEAGILEGKVGILTTQLGEAQRQAQDAIHALERMKPPAEEPKASGGRLARVWDAIWKP